mmetsp:Transcript_5230/g.11836  ORF Transcript_5230/g.11836 Transcript_5230/m.11836 type:complete len:3618 (-) Transcript_5230:38-10891(-)
MAITLCSVPSSANIPTTEEMILDEGAHKKLSSTILWALNVGFTTNDECHLLFSCWNAAAKVTLWTTLRSSWEGPASISDIEKLSMVNRLVRLREDMCEVHDLIMQGNENNSSSHHAERLLMGAVPSNAVASVSSHCRPKEALLSGVNSCEEMLSNLTVEFAKLSALASTTSAATTSATITPDLQSFAYYEALPLYVSFLMSMYTRPGNNDCGSMHRFQTKSTASTQSSQAAAAAAAMRHLSANPYAPRVESMQDVGHPSAYHTFSEEGGLDFETLNRNAVTTAGGIRHNSNSSSVARTNALTCLHEYCTALGAAPCHPDYLDLNCRFQDDIPSSVAVDAAVRALKSLTNFGGQVLKMYFGAVQSALGILDEFGVEDSTGGVQDEGEFSTVGLGLGLQLFYAQQQHPSDLSESFYSHVATVCQIDSSIFKLVMTVLSSEESCLSGNNLVATSAQRIKGADHNNASNGRIYPGEHRANGQWETLLSNALQGSCLSVPTAAIADALDDTTTADTATMNKIANALVAIHHWRRVLNSVINAMVPTAALLRFGIHDGKGRSTHSLCEELPGSIFSSISEGVPSGSSSMMMSLSRLSTENTEVGTTLQKALSFLSCVYAYSSNDEDMRLASRAAAGHLLENSTTFNDLIRLWTVRISCEAMDGVVQLLTNDKKKLSMVQQSSAYTVIEATLTQFTSATAEIVDDNDMPIISTDDALDHDKRTTLLACLGVKNRMVGRVIGNDRSDLELVDMLAQYDVKNDNESSWGWMQGNVTKLLVTLLCSGKVQLHVRARIFIAEMLVDLMNTEMEMVKKGVGKKKLGGNNNDEGVVRTSVASALDELSKEDVLLLVENNLVYSSPAQLDQCEDMKCLSEKTATVVSYIASVSNNDGILSGNGCKIILMKMLACLDKWAVNGSGSTPHMIKLLCLLASRFGALDEVGRTIVSLLQPPEKKKRGSKKDTTDVVGQQGYVDAARDFFKFVALLDRLVNQGSTMAIGAAQVAKRTTAQARRAETLLATGCSVTLKNGEEVPRVCSFVETGEGFTEQHWYNCYTCGLLWDKGCCSLCARVCHKGHDIGYSRKSSFFCDCGAEVATAIEQNRTPCKCLTPVSEDVIRELYEKESSEDNKADELLAPTQQKSQNDASDIFPELIVKSFPSKCKVSLESLVKEAKTSEWRESILLLFNQCYQTAPNPADSATDFSALFSDTAPQPITGVECPNLESRSAQPLALQRLTETSMLPIRAAKASALQSRSISSSSSSSSSHIRKARNDSHVQAIAADNRGRLYIAESSSVIFCSAIASVNVRYVENSQASHLSRSQLNILGSDSVKFPINGMAICAENNRHLLLWGTSRACVAVVSKNFDSFERVIELKLNLEPSEECEYLVKCDWMPQSELQIVAVCGTVVHVFDLKRSENNSCNATTHYALAYEDVLIRSATLIGSLAVDDGSVIETKLALLLDTGRLYFISLTIDEEGNLEDHGESYIEIGAGVSFPSAGIRRYCGGDPVPKGSTATTFGEGVFLAYLRQSNLLLYQCVSSCCIAMLLDDDGAICGSFELLPNMISADDLRSHYGVAGPYTHFQELGIVRRNDESFYRVSCVGRSTRSTQPRALVLEFNKTSVFVKELAWPTNCSAGLGFISSYNFVGSCTFSCPYIVGSNSSEGSIKDKTQVNERAFLTLLSSSGSLLCFGEDYEDHAPGSSTQFLPPSIQHQAPAAIGIFEKMINVSELDELVYGGDFVGKDHKAIKQKISLNNTDDYVISPSRDGCTLTASLQVSDISSNSIMDSKSQAGENALAIVAVRVLVGSRPHLIPREIVVMGSGRSIKLKENVKRWYDFPLTDEETLLALRNGFVTMWISSCHESSSTPIIDSVEVYARARTDLAFLRSDLDGGGRAREEMLPKFSQSYCLQDQPSSEVLVSCIQSLTFLTQIMGQSKMDSLSAGSRETISRIIQQTALDFAERRTLRDQTIEFLSEAEGDVAKRTFLIDEATLRGLMSALQGLGKYLRAEFVNVDIVSPKQEAMINHGIEMLLHILTSTVSIARTRGSVYRTSITGMIAEKACQVSMALEGKKILDFCRYLKAVHGANLKLAQPAQLLSELLLLEIAISDSADFAQFDTLSDYLYDMDSEIVKACCSAISNVIGNHEVKKINNSNPEKDIISESGIITYQCDACLVFPITGKRYTLGGDNDIDLCKQCYDLGIAYSRTRDQNDPVIINGRTLCVENEDMTCGKIWQMTSKPIAASSLKQAENAKKAGLLNNMTGPAKETALKLSTESSIQRMEISDSKQGDDIEVVKTEGFRSQMFTQLLGSITKSLDARNDEEEISPPSSYVLQLVLNLVLGSCIEELKSARGKEMALAFTKNLPNLVKACQSNESNFSIHCNKLVVSLRTLSALVLQKREINCGHPFVAAAEDEKDGAHAHHHHKDKTDPRFICEVHGVPAVRRRCSHGVHKDRRFYVCGLERNQRCNYFKWSSDVPESAPDTYEDVQNIFVPVLMELEKIFIENDLQEQFCSLVSNQFEKNQAVATVPETTLVNEGASGANFPSMKSKMDKRLDEEDGVYRTLEKFGKSKPMPSQLNDDESISSTVADGTKESFLCSSLDLFSLLAPKRKSTSEVPDRTAWSSEWFSVLCEIISTGTSTMLRNLAKTFLHRLCGDRQEIYHRVRDHYVFGFQFRKLLQRSQDILDSALVVREQARQCGSDWREEEVMFETLPAGGLLGIEDLISEDWYATSTEESIATVLDELLSAAGSVGVVTKARSNNWRQFCGLPEMAISNRKGTSADVHGDILEQIYRRPPIVSLMWLSTCLRGSNQVKALSLTDIALEDLNASTVTFQGNGVDEDDLLVGGYHALNNHLSDPEQCLLKCFTVDNLLAFIKQFVLNGRSKDLRSISSNVARKLAQRFSSSERNCLFSSLIEGPFQQVGALGNVSNNFSDLLRVFVVCFGMELDLSNVSSFIATMFISQMTTLNHYYGQNQGLFVKNETDSGGLSCNLSNCVNCQKQILPKKATKYGNKKLDNTSQSTTSVACNTNFLPEQVRPYQKGRLEASTAASVSSEFSTYYQLKFRVALSQVHVTVSDPRGRLVKTIGVYFSPRQVSDANILKSAKYTHLWQRCGTLNLPRGASEATCKLTNPVIAANLKFTYEEFYEKASSKRAPDGSFVLFCPRCTRQVNNAHGVCGNCGEVAFQCRKCRHINYDRLDAFLCVECGYCTAGGFSYEVTAGIALNAIAILDEDGFQRSMAMLRIANKRQADLRNSLKKKVMVAMQQQRKLPGDQIENLDEMVLYGPHLKRAFLGGMPKSEGLDEDDESNKKSAGSSRTRGPSSSLSERASSTSNRARSLLSLARSLRAEGGDGFGSRGDFLRQALLSAGSSSGFDSLEETDLLSALSATGATSSSSDPLSRIVANIHARARDEGRSSRAATSGAGGGGGGGKSDTSASRKDDKSKLSPSEERIRLYTQMREAERECYELNRRIDAWNCLNKDCLAGVGVQTPFLAKPFTFMPSTCSVCSLQMTFQILSLLHAVYSANISQSEHTVTSDLIKILLKETEILSPKLKDLKRRVLITLASTSEVASKMILVELQARLTAVQDVTSAEILGKLVQLDFPSVNDYINLAMATLTNLQGKQI